MALPTSTPLTHTPRFAGVDVALDLVQSNRPDVVLAYCSGMARLALTEHLKNIPLVLDMVDVDSAKWRALGRRTRSPLGWVYAREARCLGRFEAEIVAHARTTLVVNERERETLARACPRADIKVVANGIDLEQFRPSGHARAGARRVVFCGVMNYQPNEEAALNLVQRIWPLVHAERRRATADRRCASYRAAAPGPPSATARSEVTGSVRDVRPYLWNAAVSVAPLITARGLQNKVLEALAAGLPVVTTPAVAQGLPASALAGCIVAESEAESAAAILSLLRSSSTERLAFAKRADLSELSWTRQLSALVPVLTAAARRKPFIRLAS